MICNNTKNVRKIVSSFSRNSNIQRRNMQNRYIQFHKRKKIQYKKLIIEPDPQSKLTCK